MPDSKLQCCTGTIAEAQHICFFDIQLLQELGDVIGILLKTKGSVNVGCMAMCLQLDCNDFMCLCKRGDDTPERSLDCGSATMDQHQRGAAPMYFIIHVKPVYHCVASCYFRHRLIIGCWSHNIKLE